MNKQYNPNVYKIQLFAGGETNESTCRKWCLENHLFAI